MAVSSASNAVLESGAVIGGISINTGSDVPTLSASKGSLYIRTDSGGSTSATRLYVNSTGSTVWVAITTAS